MDHKRQIRLQEEGDGRIFYEEERGYGLVDARSVPGETKAMQALFAGGWNLRDSVRKSWFPDLSLTDHGVYLRKKRDVLIFKAAVPEFGTWRVTVRIRAGQGDIHRMSVFSGRRNVILRDVELPAGEERTVSFLTALTPYYPAMQSTPVSERAVYVSVSGENAGISEITIEREDAPVIYIAGDSTLTDQNAPFPYYPRGSCGGWAQAFSQYFTGAAVCNQAHSGMTTNCFRDDGHWQIIEDRLKPGDLVLFEFGHNDQKRRNLSAFGGYSANLREYAAKTREKGAFPVFLSPISRIPFEDRGRMRSLLAAHAAAVRMVSEELEVPFLDLHEISFREWCARGRTASGFFMPGDITHTNDYGAHFLADIVFRGLNEKGIFPDGWLRKSRGEKASFLPGTDTEELPAESPEKGPFDMGLPYVDIKGIRQLPLIEKAMRFGLLDPCVMYLHPESDMPRGQFLMVYLKALRLPGKRPYEGAFYDLSRYEWDSAFIQTCIDENLIDPVTVPGRRFRPDDSLTVGEYASFLIRGRQQDVPAREIGMEKCLSEARRLGFVPGGLRAEQPVSRADCYAGLVLLMEQMENEKKALPAGVELHPVG